MPALVPAIAKLKRGWPDKPGHDGVEISEDLRSRKRLRLRYMTLFANVEEGRQ
jgi:hypothetical protein